jgi:hypothetical protein
MTGAANNKRSAWLAVNEPTSDLCASVVNEPMFPIKKPLPNRQGLWRAGRFNAPAQPSSYYLLP